MIRIETSISSYQLPMDLLQVKSKYEHYLNAGIRDVTGGGLAPGNIAVWCALLEAQRAAAVVGDFMEIGVWKGHSSALMALHMASNDKIVVVDKYAAKEDFLPALSISNFADDQLDFKRECSFNIWKRNELNNYRGSVRFAHIDGEHSYEAVYNDLELSSPLLSEGGLIVLDDMFAAGGPHLTEAMFKWLWANEHLATLILTGFNKCYICHPRSWHIYAHAIYCLPDLMDSLGHKVRIQRCGRGIEKSVVGIVSRADDYKFARVGQYYEHLSYTDFWIGA